MATSQELCMSDECVMRSEFKCALVRSALVI